MQAWKRLVVIALATVGGCTLAIIALGVVIATVPSEAGSPGAIIGWGMILLCPLALLVGFLNMVYPWRFIGIHRRAVGGLIATGGAALAVVGAIVAGESGAFEAPAADASTWTLPEDPSERNARLHRIIQSTSELCPQVVAAQQVSARRSAVWSVDCSGGKTFAVTLPQNRRPVVVPCPFGSECEAPTRQTPAASVKAAEPSAKPVRPAISAEQRAFDREVAELTAKLSGAYEPPSSEDADAGIKAKCAAEWPDDFTMRAYCGRQQREKLGRLLRRSMDGTSDQMTIRSKCAREWPDDFVMRDYCEEQQLKALAGL